jgi:hypothetical protein
MRRGVAGGKREPHEPPEALGKRRLGHSSRGTGQPGTPGGGLQAQAPSRRKDRTKGTLRTRKRSTKASSWSRSKGQGRFKHFLEKEARRC